MYCTRLQKRGEQGTGCLTSLEQAVMGYHVDRFVTLFLGASSEFNILWRIGPLKAGEGVPVSDGLLGGRSGFRFLRRVRGRRQLAYRALRRRSSHSFCLPDRPRQSAVRRSTTGGGLLARSPPVVDRPPREPRRFQSLGRRACHGREPTAELRPAHTTRGPHVRLGNSFQSRFVAGGAGRGKNESIIEPVLQPAGAAGRTGGL